MSKKNKFPALLSAGAIALLLPSCVNLRAVSEYATSSVAGITQFEQVQYSYEQTCVNACADKNVTQYIITDKDTDCDCKLYLQADSVTFILYSGVEKYFETLARLSDSRLTTYDFSKLTKTLTEGDYGKIKINANDVESYSKIASIVSRIITDSYRKNKLSKAIDDANQPIQSLIKKLNFSLENLYQGLLIEKEALSFRYKRLPMLGTTSQYDKQVAAESYYERLSSLSAKQAKLKALEKNLARIALAHNELFTNKDKLNEKDVREALFQYAGDIASIATEFRKLTK